MATTAGSAQVEARRWEGGAPGEHRTLGAAGQGWPQAGHSRAHCCPRLRLREGKEETSL